MSPSSPPAIAPRLASGFSLVEVLVALFILAIASASLIEIGQRHVEALDRLETRFLAELVAENAVTEIRLDSSKLQTGAKPLTLGGRRWIVSTRSEATIDQELLEVEVAVAEEGQPASVLTLTAFVDVGAR